MTRRTAIAGVAMMLALAFAIGPGVRPAASAADEWQMFDATWTAAGTRQTLPGESGRVASIAHLSGAVVLSSGGALGGGFSGEAIGFDDGAGVSSGRAVWTDSRGDRVFSTLRGGPLQAGRQITGIVTGGTGRWTDATGEYTLTWQYVVAGDGETIQGRAADLHGRIRMKESR